VASANASAASGISSARCGSFTTSSADITTTAISGLLTGTSASGTVVNLYEDGFLVGSFTTANNNWGPIDVTNKLYSGNGTSAGILTIGVQESGREEITCPATLAVLCTGGPLTPSYTQQSSNGTSGPGATVPPGGTMTYTITNLSPNTFYSVADAATGKVYTNGTWTGGSVTSGSSIALTTYPLTTSGNYNGVVKATTVTASDMCSAKAAASSFTVLPVTLVMLKGTHSNGENLLSWKTALERETTRFDVERSTDGANFLSIGRVAAKGSNSTYAFTDSKPTSSIHYYRLRIVDADGKAAYSKTIVIKDNGALMVLTSTRPNPFVSEITVTVTLNQPQQVSATLVDAAGRSVSVKQLAGMQGMNAIKLSGLAALPPGMYVLRVSSGGAVLQEKLLKVE
jgi:hypothetical protein